MRPASLLDIIRRVPDPAHSLERWEEFHGHDLPRFSRAELLRERDRLRLRLTLDDEPDSWLVKRLRRVEAALRG